MSGFLAQAQTVFRRARGRRVLVVGDLMIDEWIWGSVTRISPEAPVPVVAVNDHSFTLGGAGNVANNLRALNAHVTFAGTVGDDDYGRQIRDLLREQHVDESGVFTLQGRPTTRKTRVVAHNQQVVRADWESVAPLNGVKRKEFAAFVRERAAESDAVIFSDYAKGLLSREVVEAALEAPLVLADPKPQNLEMFSGVTCVAPNVHEAEIATGIEIADEKSLEAAGLRLLRRLKCRYVVITRGEHGMSLFGRNGERLSVPSVAHTVFDVSGAGDTVIATLGVALATGATIKASMTLANFAAGAVVEKLGTATASPREILALVRHER
ncbi:MAG TPA: D-glycero-beta-D-manno-heptose-7-phosphate kinase [Candidatus Baltobacteraceae bacterium]|nr:D-glycero-beta-D-manno-heptose-7-phosphate kinase [Candidatus Baltobacteraceae bacterium]